MSGTWEAAPASRKNDGVIAREGVAASVLPAVSGLRPPPIALSPGTQ